MKERYTIALIIGLIAIIILIIGTIIYRIFQKIQAKKTIKNISASEFSGIVKLLNPLINTMNYPPLLMFNIEKDTALELIKNKAVRILENKVISGFKYYIIDHPCVLVFKSKDKIDFKDMIRVKQFATKLMIVSDFAKDLTPLIETK